MQSFTSGDDLIYLQLHPGDRVLESIEETIADHQIQTGVIVSGIGSLSKLHTHYVTTYPEFPEFPDDLQSADEFIDDEGAWEIGALQGAIVDHEPHLHITAYEAETDRMVAGHLEPDSVVHALMEIVIRRSDGPDLVRRENDLGIPIIEER